MSNLTTKKIALAGAAGLVMLGSQGVLAHTRLQAPTILEGTRVYNNVVIGHGCTDPATDKTSIPVAGTSVVFPDGADSILTSKPVGAVATPATATTPAVPVPETPVTGKLSDYITGFGIGKVKDGTVFALENQKLDPTGNAVGFWAGYGSLPGIGYVGLVPFRVNATTFKAESCAASVTMQVAISDICALSKQAGLADHNVNMWTPAVGSNYDGKGLHGYNSPATLKIVRNTTGTPATLLAAEVKANPLPASCGKGIDLIVKPSAAQLNRDMPVMLDGKQVWPML